MNAHKPTLKYLERLYGKDVADKAEETFAGWILPGWWFQFETTKTSGLVWRPFSSRDECIEYAKKRAAAWVKLWRAELMFTPHSQQVRRIQEETIKFS